MAREVKRPSVRPEQTVAGRRSGRKPARASGRRPGGSPGVQPAMIAGLQPVKGPGRRPGAVRPIAAAALALLALALVFFAVRACAGPGEPAEPGAAGDAAVTGEAGEAAEADARPRVSFLAVGDNVPNDVLGAFADAQKGSVGDGERDYRSLFRLVKPYAEAADLAYIDQETHVGGNDLGPKGYPSFNTTDEMADAVVDAGFDLVASATNHSYDWGPFGAVEHSRSVWNALPVAFTGTATSWDEASDIPVVERNGMTFALLSYTYGVNGYSQGEIEGYYVNWFDEDRITEDVGRAHELADVVVVAMHWGEENDSQPTDEEQRYAQLLADLGVDLVVGSHPHIIQPMTWLEGSGGNRTLVCYSLGNFIMQYENPGPYQNLEGMMTCDFVRSLEDSSISIENVKWIPLAYHGVSGTYAVWPVKDYPALLAHRNPAFADLDEPKRWLREESTSIVNALGNSFEIDC